MKKITLWLTYDLGAGGDYKGLYSWLDDNDANECGTNVAFLKRYSYPKEINTDEDFNDYFKKEILKKVKLQPGNRIYIIRVRIDESRQGTHFGTYIYGKRKGNPWEGYGTKTEDSIDE